ncbi:hypothetical protein EJ06DRAFT_2446 [Trichodelitschia bisporula]|uniref:Uncharacterized protein n=1 Tax=Trichodelitschia bisporula TaxID=703511 RepID=A0A6G1I9M8_9PEZI|nr:hypothetical protein EJ06DRAFT_2446 [Trichodelitschia bisporula]
MPSHIPHSKPPKERLIPPNRRIQPARPCRTPVGGSTPVRKAAVRRPAALLGTRCHARRPEYCTCNMVFWAPVHATVLMSDSPFKDCGGYHCAPCARTVCAVPFSHDCISYATPQACPCTPLLPRARSSHRGQALHCTPSLPFPSLPFPSLPFTHIKPPRRHSAISHRPAPSDGSRARPSSLHPEAGREG